MATISFTIPDEHVNRILDAFDGTYSGRVTEDAETGKEIVKHTKPEWAKIQIIRYVREIVKGYEARTAMEDARQKAIDDVDAIDIM